VKKWIFVFFCVMIVCPISFSAWGQSREDLEYKIDSLESELINERHKRKKLEEEIEQRRQEEEQRRQEEVLQNKKRHRTLKKKQRKIEKRQQKIEVSLKRQKERENWEVAEQDGTFISYTNGIVKDKRTGLEWKTGRDRITDWNEAKSWVQRLGGEWRMPSLDELQALYKKGAGKRNMTPLFRTTGWGVWSSKTKGSTDAWFFYYVSGSRYSNYREFVEYMRAFAVRE
jgi:hypothetical protein